MICNVIHITTDTPNSPHAPIRGWVVANVAQHAIVCDSRTNTPTSTPCPHSSLSLIEDIGLACDLCGEVNPDLV